MSMENDDSFSKRPKACGFFLENKNVGSAGIWPVFRFVCDTFILYVALETKPEELCLALSSETEGKMMSEENWRGQEMTWAVGSHEPPENMQFSL